MNDQLQKYARDALKNGLAQCSEGQQMLFKRMYSHENLDAEINDVVDNIEPSKLDWAMQQVQKAISIKIDTKSLG